MTLLLSILFITTETALSTSPVLPTDPKQKGTTLLYQSFKSEVWPFNVKALWARLKCPSFKWHSPDPVWVQSPRWQLGNCKFSGVYRLVGSFPLLSLKAPALEHSSFRQICISWGDRILSLSLEIHRSPDSDIQSGIHLLKIYFPKLQLQNFLTLQKRQCPNLNLVNVFVTPILGTN